MGSPFDPTKKPKESHRKYRGRLNGNNLAGRTLGETMKLIIAFAVVFAMPFVTHAQTPQSYLFVVEPGGLEGFSINSVTGSLVSTGAPTIDTSLPVAVATNNPASLLFAANSTGSVSVYQIVASGALTEISGSPFATSSGTQPGALAVSADSQFLYVASSIDVATSDNSGILDIFSIGQTGALTYMSSVPAPAPPLLGIIVPSASPSIYICGGSGVVQQYGVNQGTLTQLVALVLPSDGANSCVSDGQLIFVSRNVESDATGWIDSVGINSDGSLSYLTTYKAGLFVSENDLAVQNNFLFSSANTYSISVSDGNLTPTNLNWINDTQPSPLVASPTAPFLFQGSLPQFTNLVYPFLVAGDGSLTNSEPPRRLAAAPLSLTVAVGSTPAPSNPAFVFEPSGPFNFSPVVLGQNSVGQISIYSTGSVALTIDSIVVSGDDVFTQKSSTCPLSLPPSQICYIYVEFAPTSAESFTGSLTLLGNVSGSMALTGTGTTNPLPPPPTPPAQYQLSVSVNGPGTVSPQSGPYAAGAAVVIAASPTGTGTFSGWSGMECSGTNLACSFAMPASNVSIVATFAAATPTPPAPTPASLVAAPSSQSGMPGNQFIYTVTSTGFSAAPTITAACSIPMGSCLVGNGSIVTVTTTAPSAATVNNVHWQLPLGLGLLALFCLPRRKRKAAFCIAALCALGACGASPKSATVTPTPSAGTTPGTYTVQISATNGTTKASAVATLTIQ